MILWGSLKVSRYLKPGAWHSCLHCHLSLMNWFSKLFPGPCTSQGSRREDVQSTSHPKAALPAALLPASAAPRHFHLPDSSAFHQKSFKSLSQRSCQTFPLDLISQPTESITTFLHGTESRRGTILPNWCQLQLSNCNNQKSTHWVWYHQALISEGPQGICVLCNWISGASVPTAGPSVPPS